MKTKFYKKTWFIILMLFLLFPMGIYLMYQYTPWNKKAKLIISIISAFFFLIVLLSSSNDNSEMIDLNSDFTIESNNTNIHTETVSDQNSAHKISEEATKEANPETSEDASKSIVSDITVGEKNALQSAINYLNYTSFSYEGLIGQLEYEKFSHDEAVYGANNCGANWNEQALKSALAYLDYSAFSYKGLIKQLEYEKFTYEQACYGVDNCGADWNEQAAASAKAYLDYSSFSKQGLIEQLEYEGFTHEQAVFGTEENGY